MGGATSKSGSPKVLFRSLRPVTSLHQDASTGSLESPESLMTWFSPSSNRPRHHSPFDFRSRKPLIGPGRDAGVVRMQAADGGGAVQVQYAALTRGCPGKDQDRYALQGGKSGLVIGIFDGHSVHDAHGGRAHAEAAATKLPPAILRVAKALLKGGALPSQSATSHPSCASSSRPLVGGDAPLLRAFVAEFEAHQQAVKNRYTKTVRRAATPPRRRKHRLSADALADAARESPR